MTRASRVIDYSNNQGVRAYSPLQEYMGRNELHSTLFDEPNSIDKLDPNSQLERIMVTAIDSLGNVGDIKIIKQTPVAGDVYDRSMAPLFSPSANNSTASEVILQFNTNVTLNSFRKDMLVLPADTVVTVWYEFDILENRSTGTLVDIPLSDFRGTQLKFGRKFKTNDGVTPVKLLFRLKPTDNSDIKGWIYFSYQAMI